MYFEFGCSICDLIGAKYFDRAGYLLIGSGSSLF